MTENVVVTPMQQYEAICQALQIDNPPKLAFLGEKKFSKNALGVRYPGEIFIREDLPPDDLARIFVHELTHEILAKVGYKSVGHGGPFLATYQVFLHRLDLQNDSIERCACENWSRLVFWPAWYRHVAGALRLVAEFEDEHPNHTTMAGTAVAAHMLENWPHPKLLKPRWLRRLLQDRYHDFLADTRPFILLFTTACFVLFGLGFVLMITGVKLGWPRVTTTGGIFLISSLIIHSIVGWIRKARRDLHPAIQ